MSLKRQRIDVQDAPKVTNDQKKRRGKKKEEDIVLDDVDNSLESDEVIAEDDEEGNVSIIPKIDLTQMKWLFMMH
jgi:hypothetical protein